MCTTPCCIISNLQQQLKEAQRANLDAAYWEKRYKEWREISTNTHEELKQERKRRIAATQALKTLITELKEQPNVD